MSAYPEPRRLELELVAADSLTLLEYARALAAADVRDRDAMRLLRLAFRRDGDPAELASAMTLVYSITWQLERRLEPSLTWAEVQTWDVKPREPTPAEIEAARITTAADELVAKVALGTGLPPATAGELTMSQVGAFGAAHEAASKRRRRARVHR